MSSRYRSDSIKYFQQLRANQWRHWITYSPVVLKGIISDSHLRCQPLFVRACSILQMRYIRTSDIEAADMHLLWRIYTMVGIAYQTCMFTALYKGLWTITEFLVLSFERYNGLLESTHTNKKSIEPQLLRKFCFEQEANTMQLPNEEDFLSLLPSNGGKNQIGDFDLSKIMQMIYTLPKDLTFSFDIEEAPFIQALPSF